MSTSEEIEKELLEKKVQEESEGHPLDVFAANFKIYHMRAIQGFRQLSSKAKDRVMELAIKFPIEDSDKKLLNETEKTVYNVINQLIIDKGMLLVHSAGEELRKQEEEKTKIEGEKNEPKL